MRSMQTTPVDVQLGPRACSPIPDLAPTPVSASVPTIEEEEDSGYFLVETPRLFYDAALPLDASILAMPRSLVPSWDAFCAPAPWWSAADIGYVFNGNGAIGRATDVQRLRWPGLALLPASIAFG